MTYSGGSFAINVGNCFWNMAAACRKSRRRAANSWKWVESGALTQRHGAVAA